MRSKNLGAFEFPQGPKARADDGGRINLMARSSGWVMVRRPGCIPYTMPEKDWAALANWKKPEMVVVSEIGVDQFRT